MATKDQYKVLDFLKARHQVASINIINSNELTIKGKIEVLKELNTVLESSLMEFRAYKGFRYKDAKYCEALQDPTFDRKICNSLVQEYYRHYF